MAPAIDWLALEVKYLDRASELYREHLDLTIIRETDHEAIFEAGETDLVLRRPRSVPRGGLHTHYALSIPESEYDAWYDRLSVDFDLDEHTFGSARSLYFYDTEGNCVELGESNEDGTGVLGAFEVVLEVADLDRAVEFYTALGFAVSDRGSERHRVRLSGEGFDLELWEPHLGLANARGGVHVDCGLSVEDPAAALETVRGAVESVEYPDDGIRVRDPDGHYLTFVSQP